MTKKGKATKSPKSSGKPKSAAKGSVRAAMSIVRNTKRPVEERVAAFPRALMAVVENDEDLEAVLSVLRDRGELVDVRVAALQTLQAATFSALTYTSWRGDYIATLREVAEDPDPELRQRALSILARNKDGFVQKKLLEGLENAEKALLPPEKALQLLSYDIHAEAYPIARAIVSKPPTPTAKREALRLLAADAAAAPLFEKILRDKDELAEIRQISASALQALKPDRLQTHAREILLDKSEYAEIQATSLTALTQFGDDAAIAKDAELLKSVDRLSGKASTKIKQSARRFLGKFRR